MEPEPKSNSALIGSIIIIIILILGGLYYWKTSTRTNELEPGTYGTSSGTEDTSGDVDSTTQLEADINSVDLESVDEEI